MAVTIQEFLVALGFKVDPSQQSRFTDALKTSHEHIQRVGKGMSDVLGQFSQLATAATGTAIGLASALATIGTKMAGVAYSAERVGTTAPRMDSLSYAIRMVGGSAEEARAELEKVANLTVVNPGLLNRVFGVPPGTDPVEALMKIGDWFERERKRGPMAESVATQRMQNVLGIGRAESLRLGDPNTRRFYAEQMAEQQRMGLTRRDLPDMEKETDRQLIRLKQQFENFGKFLYTEWAPNINGALGTMTTWITTHEPEIKSYFTRMRVHFDELTAGANQAFQKLDPNTKSWLQDLGVIGGGALVLTASTGIMSRISGLIGVPGLGKATGILGVAFAIGLLANDYQTWKETEGKEGGIINWSRWEPVLKTAASYLEEFNQNYIFPLTRELGVEDKFVPAFEGLAAYLGGGFALRLARGGLGKLLAMLALVPGSGITAAMLSPLGIVVETGVAAGVGGYVAGKKVAEAGDLGFRASAVDDLGNPTMYYNPTTGESVSALDMRDRLSQSSREVEAGEIAKSKGGGGFRDWYRQNMPRFLGGGGATEQRKVDVRDKLADALGISREAASGIVSNLNAESGIAGINERNPVVPGSRGGFGWAQWTGPRRVDFENWAARRGLDPASDEANMGFLVDELRSKYPQVLAQLKAGQIGAAEAAKIVSDQYIIPPKSATLGHVSAAESIAKLASTAAAVSPGAGANLNAPALVPSPISYNTNSDASRTVNAPISQTVNINGVSDPQRAADLAGRALDRGNADIIRNLKPVMA